jgi:hypothetical protein
MFRIYWLNVTQFPRLSAAETDNTELLHSFRPSTVMYVNDLLMLTPWSWAILEKPIVTQILNIPTLYGTA